MSITIAELDDFHSFATEKIRVDQTGFTLDDLVMEWDSLQNREEVNEAIREGLADIEAGRTELASDVSHELRDKYQLD